MIEFLLGMLVSAIFGIFYLVGKIRNELEYISHLLRALLEDITQNYNDEEGEQDG